VFVEPFELAFNHAGDLFVANNAGKRVRGYEAVGYSIQSE
jgi:hypothetical protein